VTFDPEVLADLRSRVSAIDARRRTLLVGIDGQGGSGKSTLARDLASLLSDATVVQFDDFYRPARERQRGAARAGVEIGGDFDWRRVRDQVLKPLTTDETARYQRYDWGTDELAEWHTLSPGGVVIIEGNYATRPELRDYYDLTIWVDASENVRLRRGVERDGEDARAKWLDHWMPEEDRYIATSRPADHVDVVVDGSAGSTE
jgi:uridine kinase